MNPWNNGNSYDPEPREPFSWLSKPCIWCYAIIAFLCILFVGIGLARAEPQNLVVGQHYQGNLFACKTESDGEVLLKLISSGDTKAALDYLSADDNTCGTQASTFTPMKVIVSITSSAGVMWHLMQIEMPEGVAFLVTVASLDGGA